MYIQLQKRNHQYKVRALYTCIFKYTSEKKKVCIGKKLYKIIKSQQTVIIYFTFVTIHIHFPINIVKGYTHHVCVKFQA